jgi:hypothetical protein
MLGNDHWKSAPPSYVQTRPSCSIGISRDASIYYNIKQYSLSFPLCVYDEASLWAAEMSFPGNGSVNKFTIPRISQISVVGLR